MVERDISFEGIVISRQDYRERDMLVKIYTDNYGFKTFYIRGAKKKGFKMGASILPFTHGTYFGTINANGLSFIKAPIKIEQYKLIVYDIVKNAYASYILGLIEKATIDNLLEAKYWFDLCKEALRLIDLGLDAEVVTNIVELKLLANFGVKPNLNECVICKNKAMPLDYSESYGGLLCKNHFGMDKNRLHLSSRTVYLMQQLNKVNLKKLKSISIKPQSKQLLRQAIDEIYQHQVGVYVKAKKFIEDMHFWNEKFTSDLKKDS